MNILTNAVDAIRVGVEDWQDGRRKRLSASVRNVHAGILLLYKEALRRRSPVDSNEVFVKAETRILPDATGGIRSLGIGRRTVNTSQIREHFKNLGIQTDWKQLEAIASMRNDIEHYYANASRDSLRGVIAAAFVLVRDFVTIELGQDPRQLLGPKTWNVMLAAAEVQAVERRACLASLARIDWESPALQDAIKDATCPACGGRLLTAKAGKSFDDASLKCRSCGAQYDAEYLIPSALGQFFAWEAYVAVDDGDDAPLATCPLCANEAFVVTESRCAVCGEEADPDCASCGNRIPVSELSSAPFCGYCSHVMSKDD